MASAAFGALPFKEQIAFFERKYNQNTQGWTDVYAAEHEWAFTVAGANSLAIVEDFRKAVDKAIRDGTTLEEFRKDFDHIVAKHGWAHNGGRDWRSKVIYDTNLATSYAAGRWEQLQNAPYWEYEHADWVEHPRPEHLAWNGLVLARDDPFWQQHFPPNGWGCQCTVRGRWSRDLEKMGKTGPDPSPAVKLVEHTIGKNSPQGPRVVQVPEGIDPGFEYAPGSAQQRLATKLATAQRHSPAVAPVLPAVHPAPPVLSWRERQLALGFTYGPGWELESHEVEFFERFAQLGLRARPIQRSEARLPTNDFLWLDQQREIEVKKPLKAAYGSASQLIRDAVVRARENHGFVKDSFIIDLGNKSLPEKLRNQLAQFNVRNPGNTIRALWVMSQGELIEIELLDSP